MSTSDHIAYIKILDHTYKITCRSEQEGALQEAAVLLNNEMKKIIAPNPKAAIDRVAVVAALNFAHQLLDQKNINSQGEQAVSNRLHALQKRVEQTLGNGS